MSEEVAITAADLEHISDRDHVRERFSMYIGDNTGSGLHNLAYEVINKSVQEVIAGFAQNIHVTINNDGSMTVEDDGRGIPVKLDPGLSKTFGREITKLEAAMTILKF